jgi:hypothetical protein
LETKVLRWGANLLARSFAKILAKLCMRLIGL